MPVAAPAATTASPSLTDLKHMKVVQLTEIAQTLQIEAAGAMKKQDLIFAILQAQSKVAEGKKEELEVGGEGTLETLPDGFGFLRAPTTTTCRVPTTSTSRPRRSAASACAPATPSRGRSARRRSRALLRAAQGRPPQRRGARGGPRQDPVRQPDAALPDRAPRARARPERATDAHHRPAVPDRQGPALPHRVAAARRQDGAAAGHRPRHHRQPPRGRAHRAAHRRAARGGDRHAALGEGRGDLVDLRRAARRATCRWPRW